MATITINTTAAQDARLLPAFKDFFGMQDRTNAEVAAEYKAWLIRQTRDVVFNYEQREAQKAIQPSAAFDPS